MEIPTKNKGSDSISKLRLDLKSRTGLAYLILRMVDFIGIPTLMISYTFDQHPMRSLKFFHAGSW